ncbi:hypothetical protein [Solicola gregarius]|uniref:Uncharacterized protein n=1 Tax=Solicola gregarius TaxID=2908642 RepID=A0AA46TLS0_9ACTN|nr:hypothetical protein [Solicola gregarius]UYM07659.1 hypothetical protein L0C25_11485 [Solicola gregarius]
MSDAFADFGHTEQAAARRAEKVRALASYCWERALGSADLQTMTDAARRRLARAADVHPPSSWETWGLVCDALDDKDAWAKRNPAHPAATRSHALGRAQWVESQTLPPPGPAKPVRGDDVPLFGDDGDR